jgi:hypothetical protein
MSPIRKQIAVGCVLLYAALLWGWFLGRGARSASVEIRRSPTPGWIEVYRGGKLESEWG